MIAVDRNHACAGDRLGELATGGAAGPRRSRRSRRPPSGRRPRPIQSCDENRFSGRRCLGDRRRIVAAQLVEHPLALGELRHAAVRTCAPSPPRRAPGGVVRMPAVMNGNNDHGPIDRAAAAEVARRRAQHQPLHQRAVAMPHQLRDRSAHRVADRDDDVDAEDVGQRGDVVGAVLEPEPSGSGCRGRGRDGRGRSRGSGGRAARTPTPSSGRRSPTGRAAASRRRTGRAGDLADERRAATGQLDGAGRAGTNEWCADRAHGVRGHTISTFEVTIAQVRAGASKSTTSPTRWPSSACAERRAGRDDVEVVVALLDRPDQVALGCRRRLRRRISTIDPAATTSELPPSTISAFLSSASRWRMRPSIFPCSSLAAW